MVKDRAKKSTVKNESIYGWYPSEGEKSRGDPKEIYSKLGTRPPRDQSYIEADIIGQYHESMKGSELIYKPKQTVEEALKTPWSLHFNQSQLNATEDQEKTIPEAFKRAQSAPPVKPYPNHRVILKIPIPNFKNVFDLDEAPPKLERAHTTFSYVHPKVVEDEETQTMENDFAAPSDTVSPYPVAPALFEVKLNEEQTSPAPVKIENTVTIQIPKPTDDQLESSEEIVTTVTTRASTNDLRRVYTANIGKKSLVTPEPCVRLPTKKSSRVGFRPKTAALELLRPDSSASITSSTLKPRPKTSAQIYSHKPLAETDPDVEISVQHRNSINSALSNTQASSLELERYNMLNANLKTILSQTEAIKQASQKNGQSVVLLNPEWLDGYLNSNRQSKNQKPKTDVKTAEGHWRDQILNRSKYLHKRPNYFVKINLDKLKPDPAAPEMHYKAAETFFLNTMPSKRMTFSVDPNFISENLNIKKVSLQNRSPSAGPVKYRRDFAFVY